MPYIPKNDFIKVRATNIPLEGGKLLLAAPFMSDSYFDKTVILLVEQGSEGFYFEPAHACFAERCDEK